MEVRVVMMGRGKEDDIMCGKHDGMRKESSIKMRKTAEGRR